jgi:hypothetical protein
MWRAPEHFARYLAIDRGPFRVTRAGPCTWKIVDRTGADERLGYVRRADAAAVCRLMNAPKPQ